VTGGRGADDAVNTTTGRLGELSVAEMGEYVGEQDGYLLGRSAAHAQEDNVRPPDVM
jgi:hypothetical protein